MRNVKRLSAEKLQKVRAGVKEDCWAPGSGCDCTCGNTVFAEPFDKWLEAMQDCLD